MTHDMTKGPLLRGLIGFTIPLVLGNVLQLTYNAVDSIIVGRCVGSAALAAVSTSNPLMTLIIMFVQGISLGAGILIGNLFGAHDEAALRRQVSTGMISGSVFSLCLAALVFLITPWLLSALQVSPDIRPLAAAYLRIISCGLIFNFIYNFFASTLRAMGDSRSPLLFLGVSAVLNILGDLALVVWFRMGIAGCAVSTVVSEALSCAMCYAYITRKVPLLNMGRAWLVFDASMLGRTLRYGSVSAIQQSTVQLGILGVQGQVNSLGVTATAAFGAANRIDDYALIPERNIANAMTAVMAQNEGAGEHGRVRRAFALGMAIELSYGILAGAALLLTARPLMRLFTGDPDVIETGVIYLRMIALMYVLPAFTNGVQGYFRGVGQLKITLVSSLINMGVRFAVSVVLVQRFGMGIQAVPWSCMAGWLAMSVCELPWLIRRLKTNG